MGIVMVVNASPWGSTLGVTALRFGRALVAEGMTLNAVFFREDGVFQVQPGLPSEPGSPPLYEGWVELAESCGARLLVCSSSSQKNGAGPVQPPFRVAGLAELMALMADNDRVVTW